jgi:magnesium transporter
MKETTLVKTENFTWIDFEGPTPADLQKIGERFHLHKTSIQDCLDPEHLPKYELIDGLHFMILRAPEDQPPKNGVSVQDLTRKVALFLGPQYLITIHRTDMNCIQKAEGLKSSLQSTQIEYVCAMINSVLKSYETRIDLFFSDLENHEASVFAVPGSKVFKLKSAYYFKRKTFVFKMVLKMTRDVVSKLSQSFNDATPALQDIKENCDSLYFYVDELYENVTTLINLHVSLSTQKTTEASYKTGEVVRILTIFSIFLLPLNVITGIYGMNFQFMPELKSPWGYPAALSAMGLLLVSIYFLMNKKGWLK